VKLKTIVATTALLATTSAWAVDTSITIEGVSDYRFRGISQTAGDPAIQGSFDLAFDSGFYVGTWASNVDFGDDADIEVDFYGGYFWEINDNLGLDVMLSYYTYPGYDADPDYLELINTLWIGGLGLQFAYTNDYVSTGDSARYFAADYNIPVADTAGFFEGIGIDLHAGYSAGDYWKRWDIDSYTDFSIGVSASVKGVDMSLSYLYNGVDKIVEVPTGAFRNDDTVLFTLGYTFDLFASE
jgi:uncharacterized protein (TIGR02001 family)